MFCLSACVSGSKIVLVLQSSARKRAERVYSQSVSKKVLMVSYCTIPTVFSLSKGWASPYTGDTMPQLINGLNKLDLSIPSAAGEAYDAFWNTTKREAFCTGHNLDVIAVSVRCTLHNEINHVYYREANTPCLRMCHSPQTRHPCVLRKRRLFCLCFRL